jgi:hypothetical protein
LRQGRIWLDFFRHLSQQAFSEARQKLKWEAFRELFEITVDTPYQGEIERWHGFRVMAIDGTKINLPNDPPLREYFGTVRAGNSSPCAQGLSCMTYSMI